MRLANLFDEEQTLALEHSKRLPMQMGSFDWKWVGIAVVVVLPSACGDEASTKVLAEKPALGQEPVYQGKPLSAWVSKVGEIESDHVAEDAVAAIRAIGPEAVPFLLEWMPQPGAKGPVEGFPDWSAVEIAWWALGSAGKSAIPTLARILSEPRRTADDYSVWTVSVQAISHLGPDAIVPMLTKRGGPP